MLLSGAVMDYELNTPLNSDEVSMPGGLLALGGQQFSDFNFMPLAGFGPGTYTLIDAGSISGTLGGTTSGFFGGYSATLAINAQSHDLVLTVVPEPGTLALLAAAIGLVACKRIRAAWSTQARSASERVVFPLRWRVGLR
jgi:hypothetical protein